eukprot:scaffold26881_cov279-Cylindrotheca_fusiformis.AAC.1
MSYHRFANFGECLRSDLSKKINANLESSREPSESPCNCPTGCQYQGLDGHCRKRNVIYQIDCKFCGSSYIGNTSQVAKTRFQQHTTDTRRLIRYRLQHGPGPPNFATTSFSTHMANCWLTNNPGTLPTARQI